MEEYSTEAASNGTYIKVKGKVKFTLEQATKSQRGE
jgi:hypothetical protein